MTLSSLEFNRLLPHAGAMQLLDMVQRWDDDHIVCTAKSHRHLGHPLRTDGALRAVCGIEYAAQAVAVHQGLCGHAGEKGKMGVLAAVRDVAGTVNRLDDIASDLIIEAHKTFEQHGSAMYRFTIAGGDALLLSGGLLVMTRPVGGHPR